MHCTAHMTIAHDDRVSRVHSGLHCDDRDVFLSYVLRADPTVQSTARMMIAAVAQWVAPLCNFVARVIIAWQHP